MGATTQCFVWVQDFSGAAFHQPRVELAGVEEEEMMNDAMGKFSFEIRVSWTWSDYLPGPSQLVKKWIFISESAFAESGDEEEADNIMNQVTFLITVITSIFRTINLYHFLRSWMKSESKQLDPCHVHQLQLQRIQANLIKSPTMKLNVN